MDICFPWFVRKHIYIYIYIHIYLSVALQSFCWTLAAFQLQNLLRCRYDFLDGGSAHRKAATCTHTQGNTNTKETHTDMHALI
jgi:hypothetical protein